MSVEIRLAQSHPEFTRLCGVLMELRTHLTDEQLLAQIQEQREQGYQVAYAEANGEVLAVAGFVIGRKLAWGKHMYVDDSRRETSYIRSHRPTWGRIPVKRQPKQSSSR